MIRPRKPLALAILSLAAFALAADPTFSVRRVPKEGEAIPYTLEASFEYAGQTVKYTGKTTERISALGKDGIYTVESLAGPGKITLGEESREFSVPAIKTTFSTDGQATLIEGQDIGTANYRMQILGTLIDPGKQLAINDTWTHDFKANTKTGTPAAKAEYRLLGEEKIGEWDTLKVQATIKETEGSEPASTESTFWILKTDGSLVKLNARWTNAPFPGLASPIAATVSMTRG